MDAIFKAYAALPGKAVDQCVIVEIANWHAGIDRSETTFNRVWQAKEILTVCTGRAASLGLAVCSPHVELVVVKSALE